ncbi:MAG TPA: DUF2497 domain-containing protein [Alphaproteobacteria bacterium]|nr:DUF2497 domain-containing protein [Alphaproteobacteria bacterium]
MTDTKSSQEPSMEDILSSIRRIISEGGEHEEVDKGAKPSNDGGEVLELTKMVDEQGNLVEVSRASPEPQAEPESMEAPVPEPVEEAEPEPAVEAPPSPPEPIAREPEHPEPESLLSEQAAGQAAQALGQLARRSEPEPAPRETLRIVESGKTLEDYVLDMLRPMLKEWLDRNLPSLVERLVQREIHRVSRRADRD